MYIKKINIIPQVIKLKCCVLTSQCILEIVIFIAPINILCIINREHIMFITKLSVLLSANIVILCANKC